jgi:hypothetical protein
MSDLYPAVEAATRGPIDRPSIAVAPTYRVVLREGFEEKLRPIIDTKALIIRKNYNALYPSIAGKARPGRVVPTAAPTATR